MFNLDAFCSVRTGEALGELLSRKDLDRKYLPFALLFEWLCARYGIRLWEATEVAEPGVEDSGVRLGSDKDEELCSDFQSSDKESSHGSILRLGGTTSDGVL